MYTQAFDNHCHRLLLFTPCKILCVTMHVWILPAHLLKFLVVVLIYKLKCLSLQNLVLTKYGIITYCVLSCKDESLIY